VRARHNAGVLFERRLQAGLRDGSIRVAFRRWRRAQVVAGRRYRSPIGLVQVDAVSQVRDISEQDAVAAGYGSVGELLRDLKGPLDSALFRLELRRSEDLDPTRVLAEDAVLDGDQLCELQMKLARLDAARGRPWTRATLEAIEAAPGRRAGDLAPQLGWDELRDFKLHVRKLKALGLTTSLLVGYELSPRGAAYLQRART
jgi:hypothetical protein